MQYFKNGCEVVAKNNNWLLYKMKVVIFQHIIKTAKAIPTKAELNTFTASKYSGERYNSVRPYCCKNEPFTMANSRYQNTNNTWYFLKCNKNNCTGNEK